MGLLSVFRKVMPTRDERSADFAVFDLDRLISIEVPFMFKGKVRKIKAFDQATFLSVTNEISRLDKMRSKENLKRSELTDAYYSLFNKCCEKLSKKEVEEMTDAQVGALLQNVIDSITGRTQTEDKKKNRLNTQLTQ